MKHLSSILALAILLIVGLACSDGGNDATASENNSAAAPNTAQKDSSGEATVESITLKNADDQTITGYKATDTKHKVEVKFSTTNPGKVKGVFTAINAGGEKNFKILEKDLDLGKLMNTATFMATLENGFPAGDYKFDVYLNDKLAKTQNYKVQ